MQKQKKIIEQIEDTVQFIVPSSSLDKDNASLPTISTIILLQIDRSEFPPL